MSPIQNANYNHENSGVKLPVDELLVSSCNYGKMTLEQQEQYKLWASMSRENANNKLVQLIEHEIMNKKMNNIK